MTRHYNSSWSLLWVLALAATSTAAEEQGVSPRVLMRERFPSGLKIDRFSTSWPSSASVMADMLEGATARELLQKEGRGGRRGSSTSSFDQRMQQATALVNAAPKPSGKSVQQAPKFKRVKKESSQQDDGVGVGAMLLYV